MISRLEKNLYEMSFADMRAVMDCLKDRREHASRMGNMYLYDMFNDWVEEVERVMEERLKDIGIEIEM